MNSGKYTIPQVTTNENNGSFIQFPSDSKGEFTITLKNLTQPPNNQQQTGSSNSLSSSFIDKFINGFKVYNKFEKKNLFMSFFLVINLGLNYLKKRIKQKNTWEKKLL